MVFQVYSKGIHLHMYIYPFFFRLFSHIDYYRILSRVSCATPWVLIAIYFIHSSVYMSVPQYVGLILAIASIQSESSDKLFNFPELQFPYLKNAQGTACERVKSGHGNAVFNIKSPVLNSIKSQFLFLLLICVFFMDVFYMIPYSSQF